MSVDFLLLLLVLLPFLVLKPVRLPQPAKAAESPIRSRAVEESIHGSGAVNGIRRAALPFRGCKSALCSRDSSHHRAENILGKQGF